MQNRIVLEVAAVAENVGLCRLAVAALASQLAYSVADVEEIKVAVSEAVSNAIVHGYHCQPDKVVRLEAILDEAGLTMTITDSGTGIADIALARQPAWSTDPDRMGLGFVFMANFMDDLHVLSTPGRGTQVVMRKELRPAGTALASGAN